MTLGRRMPLSAATSAGRAGVRVSRRGLPPAAPPPGARGLLPAPRTRGSGPAAGINKPPAPPALEEMKARRSPLIMPQALEGCGAGAFIYLLGNGFGMSC